MDLGNLLKSVLSPSTPGGAPQPPGEVTQNSSVSDIASALAGAFNSSQTPPLSDYVSRLFGQSTASQQAGLLNQILAMVGPAALSGVAGGVLGKLLSPGQTQLTPEQAARVTPEEAGSIAAAAQARKPEVIDQLAAFYAQHSTLINTLGAAALTAVVSQLQTSGKDKA